MICSCGNKYMLCYVDGCDIVHFLGSSAAEHYMSHHLGGGSFLPGNSISYPPWEAPNKDLCPICWHKLNPEKQQVLLSLQSQEFVKKYPPRQTK